MKRFLLALSVLCLCAHPALAQTPAWSWWGASQNATVPTSATNPLPVAIIDSASGALTPVVSASAESSHVLKGSPGTLFGVYAINQTATTGFLLVFNATAAPADGAVTPIECIQLGPNGTAFVNYLPGPGEAFSTGITAVVSSGANCFTQTTGVITAFFHGVKS